MNLRLKNIIYTLGLFSAMFLVWNYRQNKTSEMIWVSGKTMGPITYNVKYFDAEKRNFKYSIDSLLQVFNQSLNTYIPTSEITEFNKGESFNFNLPYFSEALKVSEKIYLLTDGAFDPSIGPLINTWGFGPETGFLPDSTYIDSIQQFVGFSKIKYDSEGVRKVDARSQLSFSASAKGYGVDVVADLLTSKGITDFFVEIGGEVRSSGKNITSENPWSVGILHPDSDELNPFFQAIISLENKGMATSGNYFNYHIINGVKYGHTISPVSGFPIQHNLLSASVIANTCHEADALATAFLVMGTQASIEFLNQNPEYGGYLLFSDEEGNLSSYSSPNVTEQIKISQ